MPWISGRCGQASGRCQTAWTRQVAYDLHIHSDTVGLCAGGGGRQLRAEIKGGCSRSA